MAHPISPRQWWRRHLEGLEFVTSGGSIVVFAGAVAVVAALINLWEIWRAHRENRSERRAFGVAFYICAAFLIAALILTGNAQMLFTRNSHLK